MTIFSLKKYNNKLNLKQLSKLKETTKQMVQGYNFTHTC